MSGIHIGAVLVCHMDHTNYGSFLQAYATIKTVQSFGYNISLIRYKKKRSIWDWLKIGPRLLVSGGIESLQISWKRFCDIHRHVSYLPNQKIRLSATNNLKRKEFEPLYKWYEGYTALCKGSKEYDAIFVGSDQVWKPWGFYSYYWNLIFADDNVPKFSYAASFGVSKIPNIQIKGTKRYLERLDAISVRETKGKEIVESLSNKSATIVLDPTMLFTPEKWDALADSSETKVPHEEYLFCYFLGPRTEIREYAIRYAETNNLKIVIMRHMDEYIPIEETMGDNAPYDVDAFGFLKLLKNAKYVLTDSFHGTVFSILLKKKFLTFYRHKPTAGISTHSRIDSLLDMFHLSERKFTGDVELIEKNIDYDCVHEILAQERAKSMNYFKQALSMSMYRK